MRKTRFFRPESGLSPYGLSIVVLCLAFAVAGGLWFGMKNVAAVHRAGRVSAPLVRPEAQPPLPPALQSGNVEVAPEEAQAINAGIPVSTAPVEIAHPFLLRSISNAASTGTALADLDNRTRALDCLTAAVYYEAASENDRGQAAVAQVVLNRVRHPAFPKSVCGVVYEGWERATGCQFTFTCDGALARRPSQGGWLRARRIALAALDGAVEPTVGTATHYHADWVVPYWAPSLEKVTTIGAHVFYRWKGYWGKRSAFSGAYAGEPIGKTGPAILYDVPQDGAEVVDAKDFLASRSRLIADQGGYGVPKQEAGGAIASAPRADQNGGTLLADQDRGILDDKRSVLRAKLP